ncbi:hypothetical protein I204_07010 [Kwoniella mangroviensis CBS 8886]|uniref:uncharacterized protein n=1 Tax=Kwoniella mangroviensis CBS 8507 TaxID=1296122 RepID=UPI00080D0173|nr:uncharacterized protein I203_01017 [Kwoniella mangroviensis CBS 8507]OCF69164.1 hypothetical protein I203_01017 [Kwoniella mangroviensis CBS 8507]OCF72627.1 hypothetical protein I204_07010 [Kwoniella mangroviensis CBS 8886]
MSSSYVTSSGPKIRYALFGITTIIFILSLLLNLLLPGFGYDSIGFINLWNRRSRFDQAGGEVAVGVLITISWLACVIVQLIFTSWELCDDPDSGFYTGGEGCQAGAIAFSVLFFLNLLIHFGWTTWIIVLVHRRSNNKKERDEVYKISTHVLVKGGSAQIEHVKISDVDEEGLYNLRS